MSDEPFNCLAHDEAERLALLAEECAETIQIVGKILRHGYHSTHPDNPDGPCNTDMLEIELGHIEAAKELMFNSADIARTPITIEKRKKLKKVKIYLHHQ